MSTALIVRPAPERKRRLVEEIKGYIRSHRYLIVADLYKVRTAQLQELRRMLMGQALIKILKNTLVSRAIDDVKEEKRGLEALEAYLCGQSIFIFTNENPFELARLVERFKVKALPAPGDVATSDIVVPAGNTGMPPGPIISTMSSLGIPTRIEAGSIWVARDTVVARKGDIITYELAYVLSKLGIRALELGVALKAAYMDGFVIPGEDLSIDVEAVRRSIAEAMAEAINLSLNASYPTKETSALLIQLAHARALSIALAASIPTPEVLGLLLAKAEAEIAALSKLLAEKGFR